MAHFLLGLALVGGATIVAVEAIGIERGQATSLPREIRRIALALACACGILVVTGAFATAAGPHPGGSKIARLGTLLTSVYVHAAATAAFGVLFAFLLGYLAARRDRWPLVFKLAAALLGLLLVQMAIGETQYRTHLPWWLVLVHVSIAAAVWAGTLALATVCFRPPATIAAPPA
jgi:cytochrome c oxidase assembly protein subunit 15